MTAEDVRVVVAAMKTQAAAVVRARGQLLGVDPAFVAAICAALGDISLDEALDALTREGFRLRQSIIEDNRKADTP